MEITEQLEKGLAKIHDQIEAFEAKQAEEVKNLGASHEETMATIKNLTEKAEAMKDRIDSIEKNTNRIPAEKKTFGQTLTKAIAENAEKIHRLKEDGTRFKMELKSPMTATGPFSVYTGEVVESDRLAGVYFDPDRPTHARQLLPSVSTDSNNVRYVIEESYNDQTGMQVEGYEKPQSDFKLKAVDAPVETIATYIRLSRQMLDDTAFLTSYINQRLPKKLFIEEDAQVLYGDGNSPNLEGITEVAQAWTGSGVNQFDELVSAISQARTANGEYMANGILINPADWYTMLIEKDGEGRYQFPDAVRFGGQPPRIAGVPIFQNTAMNAGEFLVGDWAMGATLAVRQGVSLTFHEEDQDNVIKNLITVRIEERLALPIHNPNAFVYGEFAS